MCMFSQYCVLCCFFYMLIKVCSVLVVSSCRDVIETIGKVTYLLAMFVFMDNTQVNY